MADINRQQQPKTTDQEELKAPVTILDSAAAPPSRQDALGLHPNEIDQVWVHGGCPDGMASATVAYLYQQLHRPEKEYEFRYLSHGLPVPVAKDANIVIIDYCPTDSQMEILLRECKSLHIRDHHKSSIPVMIKYNSFCTYDMQHSGVGLAWEYFFPNRSVPDWVRFVEARDLWKFDQDGESIKQIATFLWYSCDATPKSWAHKLFKDEKQDFLRNVNKSIYKKVFCVCVKFIPFLLFFFPERVSKCSRYKTVLSSAKVALGSKRPPFVAFHAQYQTIPSFSVKSVLPFSKIIR